MARFFENEDLWLGEDDDHDPCATNAHDALESLKIELDLFPTAPSITMRLDLWAALLSAAKTGPCRKHLDRRKAVAELERDIVAKSSYDYLSRPREVAELICRLGYTAFAKGRGGYERGYIPPTHGYRLRRNAILLAACDIAAEELRKRIGAGERVSKKKTYGNAAKEAHQLKCERYPSVKLSASTIERFLYSPEGEEQILGPAMRALLERDLRKVRNELDREIHRMAASVDHSSSVRK